MAHLFHKDAISRIAEAFLVVGAVANSEQLRADGLSPLLSPATSPPSTPISGFLHQRYEPMVLHRYPVFDPDECSQRRTKDRVPEGVEIFCFPQGVKISGSCASPRFHSFVMTSEVGARILGFALTINEELTEAQYQWVAREAAANGYNPALLPPKLFVSKALCLLSYWPFVTAFKKFLLNLYKLATSRTSVPIERVICNFIDDVPAPPAGRVDISYFIADESISFRCPPLNEPNAWLGIPLFPLFECLSAENICALFACVLVERQVLLVSSQYSLLTLCAEGIVSLLYPLSWAHAYIPILPSRLTGVLGAPFPFIIGMHNSLYNQCAGSVSPETVKVFLDHDRLDFGSSGPPPPLPEARYRKLLSGLEQVVPWYGNSAEKRGGSYESWRKTRLRKFDDASSSVADHIASAETPLATAPPVGVSGKGRQSSLFLTSTGRDYVSETGFHYAAVRECFLKFFVSLLMNYKKYLIYFAETTEGAARFQFDRFLADHPAEWQPLLRQLVPTQAFSQFVDQRVMLSKLDRDVIYFDESIDAKLNRYLFRLRDIDTPFLSDRADMHIKTYVPPSPSTAGLDKDAVYVYHRFPDLNPALFIPPRHLAARFARPSDQLMGLLSRMRLKRKIALSQKEKQHVLPGASMVFSSYILCLSQFIAASLEAFADSPAPRIGILSTQQLLERYGSGADDWPLPGRRLSIVDASDEGQARDAAADATSAPSGLSSSGTPPSAQAPHGRRHSRGQELLHDAERRRRRALSQRHEFPAVVEAARVGLKVAFEALNTLTRLDYIPDELVFRCLAEVCADLGESDGLLDLIVYMDLEGYIPDHQIRHALIRSLMSSTSFFVADYPSLQPLAPPPHGRLSLAHGNGGSDAARNALHGDGNSLAGNNVRLHPALVWTYFEWQKLRRSSDALLVYRDGVKHQSAGVFRSFEAESVLTKMLFGPRSSAVLPPSDSLRALASPPQPPSGAGQFIAGAGNSPKPSLPKDRWSENVMEGHVPSLQWQVEYLRVAQPLVTASPKLQRLFRLSEQHLVAAFPRLRVDFASPFGMKCPGMHCPARRVLALGEVYQGWSSGDPHKYTTRCVHCHVDFIPRFSVSFPAPLSAPDGHSAADLSPLESSTAPMWCELLSPWTLHKEVCNVVFEDGIHFLLSLVHSLAAPETNGFQHQRAVVFYNLLVTFRLRGLPYGFLLTNGSLKDCFPPNTKGQATDRNSK